MTTPVSHIRDGTVEWPVALPKGWAVRRLKHVAEIFNSNVDKKSYEDGLPVRLCNYTDVYYNEYIRPTLNLMKATASPSEVERFSLRRGDVLITKDSESWDDIAVPACVAEAMEGVVCGYHLTMLRPRTGILDGRFLLRALQASGIREQFYVAAKGITRYGLSLHHVQNAVIPVPPIGEQRSLADFLDRKTTGIDTLIQKKQALIGLLKEQRTAVINHAVTKGLDPKVPMKDSGIGWLGEVPEHWKVAQLRYVANLKSGDGITSEDIEPVGEYPVYGGNGLRGYTSRYTHDGYYALIGRQGALCGNVNFATGKFWASEHAVVVAPYGNHRTGWLGRLLESMNLGQYSVAAAQPGLAVETIKALRLPVPPPTEQEEIESFINERTEQISVVIAREEKLMGRLLELRASLISEVVTGKMDVRSRPEEATEIGFFAWLVLANHVIRQLRSNRHFGRLMLVKVLFVIQHHLRVKYGTRYVRYKHGPLDRAMLGSVERRLAAGKWHRASRTSGDYDRVEYLPLDNADDPKNHFVKQWGGRSSEIDRLIRPFAKMTSRQAEIVATLYAAWNDLLLRGVQPSDDEIVNEVFTWHPAKRSIAEEKLRQALAWMRSRGLVPSGFGTPTVPQS